MAESAGVPEKFRDLLSGKKAFASLGTIMPNGEPQVTPVWFDYDGKNFFFNSARGRQKDLNVRRDPRVSMTIIDPDNPYRYLEVRGRVTDITQEGADAHINKMAKKYLDKDVYPFRRAGEVRVLYTIRPEKMHGMG